MSTTDFSMRQALHELRADVEPLRDSDAIRFEEDGYLNLGQLLTAEEAARIVTRLEELAQIEGDDAGKDGFAEAGTASLGALVNKDPLFDVLFLHPRLLSAIAHFMGEDFGVSSLTSRAALPGEGHQALHWDSGEPCAINALWVLTDFSLENGPTRFVPGSHTLGKRPEAVLVDPLATHPEQRLLIAPAGTLVLLNARTWHSGTRNRSTTPRHMASTFFMRRGRYQAGNVDRRLQPATWNRFGKAALYILDHLPL